MAAAGRLGKPLLTWTVDSPADLHRGLELGVNAGGPKNGAGRGKELLMSISADMDCTSGQLEAYKRSLPLPAWQHLLLGPRLQSAPSCPAHVHLPLCAAVCCSGVQRPARAAGDPTWVHSRLRPRAVRNQIVSGRPVVCEQYRPRGS